MTTPQSERGSLPDGGTTSGPTVLRMLLGSQLRKLREAKNISRESAGWEIRASESKISRMELGRVGFKERDVADLLTLYGVTDPEERDALLTLARDANAPGWWQRYSDILPHWFQPYLGLEAAAALCEAFGLPLSAHTAPALHLHVCCALAPVRHIEYFHDHVRIEAMLFDGVRPPRGGVLYPDLARPGLGLELKHADARRYRVV